MAGGAHDAELTAVRAQAAAGNLRVSIHAAAEMVEEGISLDEVLEAIDGGEILENYPEHRRGPCALLGGRTGKNRWLHVVCTTGAPRLVIITTYEPKPPKWATPTQRGIL